MRAGFTSLSEQSVLLYTSTYFILPEGRLIPPPPPDPNDPVDPDDTTKPANEYADPITEINFGVIVLEEVLIDKVKHEVPRSYYLPGELLRAEGETALPSRVDATIEYRVRFFKDPISRWLPYRGHSAFATELSRIINTEKSRLKDTEDQDKYNDYPILCQVQFQVTSECGDKVSLSNIDLQYTSSLDRSNLRRSSAIRLSPLHRFVDFFDYDAVAWGLSVFQKLQSGGLMPAATNTFTTGFKDTMLPICVFFGTLVVFGRRLFTPQGDKAVYLAFLRSQGHFPCSARSLSEILALYNNRIAYMFQRGGTTPLQVGNEAAEMLCATTVAPLINVYHGLDANFVIGRDRGNRNDGFFPMGYNITQEQIRTSHSYYISVPIKTKIKNQTTPLFDWVAIWGVFKAADEVITPAIVSVNSVSIASQQNVDNVETTPSALGNRVPSGLITARKGVDYQDTDKEVAGSVLLSANNDRFGQVSTALYARDGLTAKEARDLNTGRRGRGVNNVVLMEGRITSVELYYTDSRSISNDPPESPYFDLTISPQTQGLGRYLNVHNRHIHVIYDNQNNDYSPEDIEIAYERYFIPYYNTVTFQGS